MNAATACILHTRDSLDFVARGLAFTCPKVEARLLDEDVVDTAEEAALLFREVKRFLVLSRSMAIPCPMVSMRVDAGWHAFLMFTADYADFCHRALGRFMTHDPGAPRMASLRDTMPEIEVGDLAAAQPEDPRTLFAREYQALYGEPPGEMWQDERAVHAHRRIKNPGAGQQRVRREDAKVALLGERGEVRARMAARAEPALAFIADHRRFYVRELPGLAREADAVALVRALVASGTLELCI
ncbi:MAG: hypothetical protein HOO96_40940 [Polyangiaceae bacterium]|nr:hypothetical protein [Polyangiaceae bacterium]